MTPLTDKAALVTGASRGIGEAIALALAAEGMSLSLVARDEKRLVQVADECLARGAKNVVTTPCDLSDPGLWKPVVDRAIEKLTRLDVLVNNAGAHVAGPADRADFADWERAIALNLRALMALTRFALPHIEKQGAGAVVNIASIAGLMTTGGNNASYIATKHGVVGFTEALFEDVREKHVKVTAICPGMVNTDLVREGAKKRTVDPARMIQPEDVALAVLYVLRSPATVCPTQIVLRPQRTPYVTK